MSKSRQSIRQSISLPLDIARSVRAAAKARRVSANRVIVDLVEAGLQAKRSEKQRFFALANRLSESGDPSERQKIKEELARMTFGE